MSTRIAQMVIDEIGDRSRLHRTEAELPAPGPGEVRVRHTAIGVNYVDIYHRTGLYALPPLPVALGVEAAGVVEAVGPQVEGWRPGQRVAYAGPPVGAYSTARNVAAARLVALPDEVSDDTVAGALLRGITAHMLMHHVYPLRPGQTVLVHAAAGGLGLVLVQWAKSLGAKVIGTVGSADKAALALSHGLDHAIRYRDEDFVQAVLEWTQQQGVDFAIDGIGGETLKATLATVRAYGMVASVGQVAGDPGPIDLSWLGPARSVALSRPGVFRFMSDLARYHEGAQATLRQLQNGLRVSIGQVLPLAEAAEAHRLLETGQTTGAILLRP